MPEILKVLIADDHPVFRYGMRAMLGAEPDTELIGEAISGEEAVRLAATLRPDVILMDINMPGMNGIDAARRISEAHPRTGILMLTMFEDDDSIFAAMRAGARGYVLKGADGAETLRAIRAVANGQAIFSSTVALRLMQYFSAPRPDGPREAFPELTERERDILALLARGYTNLEISQRLYLSQKTVRNYVSNIFTKLHVADRAQAIIRAREAGLDKGES